MKATISPTRVPAIDLGKFKSVACLYDVATRTSMVRTIETSNNEVRQLLQDERGITVVIEACSPAGWVHDLCEELGVRCLVANTNGDAWAWKNVKRKTDKDDALKLARLAAVEELAVVPVPPKAIRQRKSLIGLRKRFVGERVQAQNRIRGLFVGQGLAAPRGAKAWTEVSIPPPNRPHSAVTPRGSSCLF